jgi:hypothetical protein
MKAEKQLIQEVIVGGTLIALFTDKDPFIESTKAKI